MACDQLLYSPSPLCNVNNVLHNQNPRQKGGGRLAVISTRKEIYRPRSSLIFALVFGPTYPYPGSEESATTSYFS